jgi:hypothetical protein
VNKGEREDGEAVYDHRGDYNASLTDAIDKVSRRDSAEQSSSGANR